MAAYYFFVRKSFLLFMFSYSTGVFQKHLLWGFVKIFVGTGCKLKIQLFFNHKDLFELPCSKLHNIEWLLHHTTLACSKEKKFHWSLFFISTTNQHIRQDNDSNFWYSYFLIWKTHQHIRSYNDNTKSPKQAINFWIGLPTLSASLPAHRMLSRPGRPGWYQGPKEYNKFLKQITSIEGHPSHMKQTPLPTPSLPVCLPTEFSADLADLRWVF